MFDKCRTFVLVSVPVTLLALAAMSGSAQAQSWADMKIWNSSHCLDNATEDARKLQMWNCTGHSEQLWWEGFNTVTGVFTFLNQHTGWCITAPASGPGHVSMEYCDASATNQQWRVFAADNPNGPPSGWYDVWQNVASGYCLSTNSLRNGNEIETTPCDPSDHYDRWARD